MCAIPLSASAFELNSLDAKALPPAEVPAAAAPQAADKASYIQMMSSTKLKLDREKGELTLGFPKDVFGDPEPGDKAHLFVKMTRGLPAPVISWATVLCSNGHYLGYKGSTVALPEASGALSVSETLALGNGPKRLIERTHPWLAEGLADLGRICSADFLEGAKDLRAETLPAKLGDFSFDYSPKKNTLKVKWN